MSKQAPGGSLEGGLPPVRLPSPVMHAASPVNGPTPRRTLTTWNIVRGVGVALASANDVCACGDARMHHFPYAVLTGNLQGLSPSCHPRRPRNRAAHPKPPITGDPPCSPFLPRPCPPSTRFQPFMSGGCSPRL